MQQNDKGYFRVIFILFMLTGLITLLLIIILNLYDAGEYSDDNSSVALGALLCSLLIMPLIIATFSVAIFAYKHDRKKMVGNAVILLVLSFIYMLFTINSLVTVENPDAVKGVLIHNHSPNSPTFRLGM